MRLDFSSISGASSKSFIGIFYKKSAEKVLAGGTHVGWDGYVALSYVVKQLFSVSIFELKWRLTREHFVDNAA